MITKIECWPVFKQDPIALPIMILIMKILLHNNNVYKPNLFPLLCLVPCIANCDSNNENIAFM